MKGAGRISVLMIVFACPSLEAQPRAPELRFHFGTASFWEARRHVAAGVSCRYYFGKSGWAVEPEYSFMTDNTHQDHMLIMNLVKDLTRPSRNAVLYTLLGGGMNWRRARVPGLGGLGWGMGVKVWANDRFFISPQFRLGLEPNLRFSVYLGFAKRRERRHP